MLHGVEGFGASTHLHEASLPHLSENLPAVVVIVDESDRLDAFMPVLDELIGDGLVVSQPVEVMVHRGRT